MWALLWTLEMPFMVPDTVKSPSTFKLVEKLYKELFMVPIVVPLTVNCICDTPTDTDVLEFTNDVTLPKVALDINAETSDLLCTSKLVLAADIVVPPVPPEATGNASPVKFDGSK